MRARQFSFDLVTRASSAPTHSDLASSSEPDDLGTHELLLKAEKPLTRACLNWITLPLDHPTSSPYPDSLHYAGA